MSVVKCYNKKVGVTYVYNSETYWDPERKHSRAKRELIGILDEKNRRDYSHEKKRRYM